MRRCMTLGLAFVSMAVLTGASTPPSGAPQVGITSPIDNDTIWGRVFVTGTMIDPDASGSIKSVTVTVQYPSGWFSNTKIAKTFTRCSSGDFALDCSNPTASDADGNSFSLDANGDFVYSRKPLTNINKVTVKATDNANVSGEDSVPVKYDACSTQTNPNYASQTYANDTWTGDYKACGQNTGTYFLTRDFDGNPVTIKTITGSLILINNIVSDLLDAAMLENVQKDLVIRGQNYMTSLTGIDKAKVAQRVVVHKNYVLTDVDALFAAVTSLGSTPVTLEITDNPALSTCDADQLVADLRAAGWNGVALVAGNASCP